MIFYFVDLKIEEPQECEREIIDLFENHKPNSTSVAIRLTDISSDCFSLYFLVCYFNLDTIFRSVFLGKFSC